MKVIILHGEVPPGANPDEEDVLTEVRYISSALADMGYEPVPLPFSLDFKRVIKEIEDIKASFIFNLVESVEGKGKLIHFAPALLDYLKIPYTGSATDAIYLTSNKLIAKQILSGAGISTPPWSAGNITFEPPYILKSVWEHASIGLNKDSVIYDKNSLKNNSNEYFTEAYIDGREFNISILDSKTGPQVMPLAEMLFIDYPDDKPKIVDYEAKWNEGSFEYVNTKRTFDFSPEDLPLINKLNEIAIKSWNVFGLNGYGRVDFRVDNNGNPMVLEVNINPCLSPDSGFIAATEKYGLNYNEVIERIISVCL